MTIDRTLEGRPLDEWIALAEFCRWLHVEPSWVVGLVDAGVLEPRGPAPEAWSFPAGDLMRARRVVRLVDDLGVNVVGAAVILDLVEERRALERRLRMLERLLEE
jgi:chaperone modulatory protein CbpM